MILQKFFADTLGGRFIKSLLAQTPVPILPSVCYGDYIVSGCYYVYKDTIIQCTESGPLVDNHKLISLTDELDQKTFSTYHSTTNYYDPETHYHLGRYLRYLKTTTGLNLLPFYNCYNANYVNDTELVRQDSRVTARRTNNLTKKVVAVPIRINTEYTIAISSSTEVLLCPVLRDSYGYIDSKELNNTTVTDLLNNSSKSYSNMIFSRSVNFMLNIESISGDKNRQFLAEREKYLYLLIQLDIDNNSSIVVIENSVRKYDLFNSFLLSNNYNVSYAFSDRLIEYLLNNVVHSQEWYGKNIAKVQSALRTQFSDYDSSFRTQKNRLGIYDAAIPNLVHQLVQKYSETNNIYDQDGNINVDVEKILLSKGTDY